MSMPNRTCPRCGLHVTEQDHAVSNVETAIRWVALGQMQVHWQHRACPALSDGGSQS